MLIGMYGGSFNPPHCGHVLVASYALAAEPFDRVVVVPTFVHPFGKALADYEHRVRMCELAFASIRGVEISRIEEELGGPSYTVATLEALKARQRNADFRLLLGTDLLPYTDKWANFERVRELAPLYIVGRQGARAPQGTEALLEMPEVSSTEIRERIRDGRSTRGLLPYRVAEYCAERELYRDAS